MSYVCIYILYICEYSYNVQSVYVREVYCLAHICLYVVYQYIFLILYVPDICMLQAVPTSTQSSSGASLYFRLSRTPSSTTIRVKQQPYMYDYYIILSFMYCAVFVLACNAIMCVCVILCYLVQYYTLPKLTCMYNVIYIYLYSIYIHPSISLLFPPQFTLLISPIHI